MWDAAGLRFGVRGAEVGGTVAGMLGRGTIRASGERDAGIIRETSGWQRRANGTKRKIINVRGVRGDEAEVTEEGKSQLRCVVVVVRVERFLIT